MGSGRLALVAGVPLLAVMVVGTVMIRAQLQQPNQAVDYLGQLEAEHGPRDRAREAWPRLQPALVQADTEDLYEVRCAHPGQDGWRDALTWLDENRSLLPGLVEAGACERLGFPYRPREHHESWARYFSGVGDEQRAAEHRAQLAELGAQPPRMWDIKLGEIMALRVPETLLLVAAREAESEGRLDLALERVEAVAGLSRQLSKRGTLMEVMIGCVINMSAQREARRLLTEHHAAWDDESLARLANTALCSFELPTLEEGLHTEKNVIHELAQSLFSDDGDGDGHLLLGRFHEFYSRFDEHPMLSTLRALFHAGRKETVDRYEELFEAYVAAAHDPSLLDAAEDMQAELARPRYAALSLLRLSDSVLRMQRGLQGARIERGATAATVALVRYHHHNGAWPTSWEQIVPTFLDHQPADASAGSLLGLEFTDDNAPPRIVSAEHDLYEV